MTTLPQCRTQTPTTMLLLIVLLESAMSMARKTQMTVITTGLMATGLQMSKMTLRMVKTRDSWGGGQAECCSFIPLHALSLYLDSTTDVAMSVATYPSVASTPTCPSLASGGHQPHHQLWQRLAPTPATTMTAAVATTSSNNNDSSGRVAKPRNHHD